jgi:WhiB family transcriptional regulator, redox-sensing transcriptional regulator
MSPMQWRDATVGGVDSTGFEGFEGYGPGARRKPDVRPIKVGDAGQASQVRPVRGPAVSVAGEFVLAGSGATPPMGLDLPCRQDPELFFAESPAEVEQAKAVCHGCRARIACLAGALQRREPCGVWGGELLLRGAIVPRKRPRGRPRKTDVAA